MSMVRFATLCDKCQRRSEEYTSWPTCKDCVTRHEVVYWFTTPTELRAIADEMEAHWKTCAPGQDKTVRTIWDKSTQFCVLVDQERIESPGWNETAQEAKERIRSSARHRKQVGDLRESEVDL